MSYFFTPVPNLEHAVKKPVMVQALKQLVGTYFMESDTQIDYYDHTGQKHTIGSDANDQRVGVELKNRSVVRARSVTTPLAELSVVHPRDTPGNKPVWGNADLKAHCYITRQRSRSELEISYTCPSKAEANNWVSQFISKLGMGGQSMLFHVDYEVPIPNEVVYILKELYGTLHGIVPQAKAFPEWFRENFTGPYDIRSNILGAHKTPVIRETLRNLVAVLPNETPKPERNASGSYEISITLDFQWDVPAMVHLDYPIYLKGQEIPPKLFDINLNRNAVHRTHFEANIDAVHGIMKWNDDEAKYLYTKIPYIYPPYDPDNVKWDLYKVSPVLQFRMGVDPNNRRDIVELDILEEALGIKLHPQLIPYMAAAGDAIFIPGLAGVTVLIARDGKILDFSQYTLDGRAIKAKYDLDPLGNYHVLLCVSDDLYGTPEPEVPTLLQYGDLVNAILRYNYPRLKIERFPTIKEDGSVSAHDLVELKDVVNDERHWPGNRMYTASTILVETKYM